MPLMEKWRYGVILDAGSSGTRVHVYRWKANAVALKDAKPAEQQHLPEIKTEKKWTKKTKPGIATFGEDPLAVGPDHLRSLFDHALEIIPKESAKDTPLFLLATAGVRLLPEIQRKHLLAQVCEYARKTTEFQLPDCDLHVQAIPGETEGLYGWIAANYLLGGFDAPEDHSHGKGHHTYGFLDMGGASAQIAFAPNTTEAEKHANDLKLLRLRSIDGTPREYRVFVTTWLGFGVHEARRRYVDHLVEENGAPERKSLPDPCLPVSLNITQEGTVIQPGSKEDTGDKPSLMGTGGFQECLRKTLPLLEKDKACADPPCLLGGVHVPAIDFDVNHFVGVSEYWHTTHEIFEMAHKDKSYDFHTYQKRVKEFCSQQWDDIERGIQDKTWGKKVDEETAAETCFKASWLINMLHEGIGVPREGIEDTKGSNNYNGTKEVIHHATEKGFLDPFQAVDKIQGTEVSWTLGKMVLYASSEVPMKEESALPVGFGSNVGGVPADFQPPSVKLGSHHTHINEDESVQTESADLDWHDTLLSTKTSRRLPGFLLFLMIVCIVLFLWCGRDRRSRLGRQIFGFCGKRSGGSKKRGGFFSKKLFGAGSGSGGHYERVLEDGEGSTAFELGDGLDSSEEEFSARYSDSSDKSRTGHASGWDTPGLKVSGGPDDLSASSYHLENASASNSTIMSQGIGLGLGPGLGNAMDRSGLVVRTDSRETLAQHVSSPGLGGKTPTGRRSRTASPGRKAYVY